MVAIEASAPKVAANSSRVSRLKNVFWPEARSALPASYCYGCTVLSYFSAAIEMTAKLQDVHSWQILTKKSAVDCD